MNDTNLAAALQRSHLSYFLVRVFEEIHPGEPALDLEPYIEAMCYALAQVHEGKEKRLVITVPPRYLKSITCSVAFTAWCLGHNPGLRILVASYGEDLAEKHAMHFRKVMESGWYQKLFPGSRIDPRGNRKLELVTTKGGFRKAVSVGGAVTGHGADLIIIDDLTKADEPFSEAKREECERFLTNTLFSRLNDKRSGAIIAIQQRLHEADVAALLLEKGYTHLNLPAIAEAPVSLPVDNGRFFTRAVGDTLSTREPHAVLAQLRRDIGPMVFSAQWQQNPVSPEGNLVRLEWFPRYDKALERSCYHKVVQSWDTASSLEHRADWSVCLTWGYREKKWYLLDVLRRRMEYPDLKRAVLLLHHQWQPDRVLIERANSGLQLVQELRHEGRIMPFAPLPFVDKQTRLIGHTARLEEGRFYLPAEAPWLEVFCRELQAFPAAKHNDQVDALTQFLQFELDNLRWTLMEFTPSGRPVGGRPRPPGRSQRR